MNAKKTLVSFFAIASVLLLVATVSASDFVGVGVKVDDINANNRPAIIAGETVTIDVFFTSQVNSDDVKVKVEIEGDKVDVQDVSSTFDVEEGERYKKTFKLKVPYELKDQLSDEVTLNLKIWGGDTETYRADYDLRVQRPSYNTDIKSVDVKNTVQAGENFPVDIVLKNIGYNDLDDLYVKVSIPALGIEKQSYFGDLVALECDEDSDAVDNYGVDINRKCDEDDEDTVSGRLYLEVPYEVDSGIYTLEVEVSNDDFTDSVTRQVAVKNDFPETILKTGNGLFFVNPTNELKVYRVVQPSSEIFVSVPADSTKTLEVNPDSQDYTVSVFTISGQLINAFTFSQAQEDESRVTSPIIVLTVILAIVFLVLLVVLIVLIGKKPEKSEEFGESYY